MRRFRSTATNGHAGGTFVVSLDFELHWGVRDKYGLAEYGSNLLGARAAVPAMLDLFAEHGVRATWAVVGLLLADSKREMLERWPTPRPRYRRAALAAEADLAEVGENEREDPFHFAPGLVRRIAESPGQEVATHTFSHLYCLEDGSSPECLRADLEAAIALSEDKLGRRPHSIVFPRNQFDAASLAVCRELGLTAYRGNPRGWAYGARRDEDERQARRAVRLLDAYLPLTGSHVGPPADPAAGPPVDVPASRYLRPYAPAFRHLEPLRLHRITSEMRRAADGGGTFHLWWHPHDFGCHPQENLAVLRHVLGCFRSLRETHGMESRTMSETAGSSTAASR